MGNNDKSVKVDGSGKVLKHSISEINEGKTHFSVEPSKEKEYDIMLMTGKGKKGSDKK